MIGTVSVAAATAVVGYDLFQNEVWNVSDRPRRLRGIAVAGSAAAGDAAIDLYIGRYYVGRFYNLATGFPNIADHMIPLKGNLVPAGSKISCVVADAPGTNPINIILV